MKKYYQIRKSVFWIGAIVLIICLAFIYFKTEIMEMYVKANGRETVSYQGVNSKLENTDECYLCGSHSYSVVGDYRGKDMVGIISVNDWYVLDFGLENAEESESSGSQSHYGNTGELNYQSHILKEQGIAEMNITLPDSYQLKLNVIRNHLCQPCLEKVLESLEYNKWKTEEKEAIPLCLIDFKTLEVYSIQEISHKYIFERCYVKIDNDKNQSSILVARY